jgi:hypothetical protein
MTSANLIGVSNVHNLLGIIYEILEGQFGILRAPTAKANDVHRRFLMNWTEWPRRLRPKRAQNAIPAPKVGT